MNPLTAAPERSSEAGSPTAAAIDPAGTPPTTLDAPAPPAPMAAQQRRVVDALLLAAPRVSTFLGTQPLTGASGFFFEREQRLYLVTSRHVVIDAPSKHFPDRLEIELHTDEQNLSRSTTLSLLLYRDSKAVWRQARDSGGEIDVAVIQIDRATLNGFTPRAFTPQHIQQPLTDAVEIGTSLLVIGFPLGFHDGMHHLPVARHAVVASAFGTRFQGQGLFLTDARTHRGTSGAPVVTRDAAASGSADGMPWKLLGIHSSRMDMSSRDLEVDESLGLNCTWYADILLTLTAA